MRPSLTASSAGSASGRIFTNHCSDTSGSATVPQRWQWPTEWLVGLDLLDQPLAASAPPPGPCAPPASAFPRTCRPPSSCCRRGRSPGRWAGGGAGRSRSRSGSCPGVTLTAPEPKAGSTASSATIGIARPISGHHRLPADHVPVARVLRMHGDGRISQDRLRPGGRHHRCAGCSPCSPHRGPCGRGNSGYRT